MKETFLLVDRPSHSFSGMDALPHVTAVLSNLEAAWERLDRDVDDPGGR
ncbi:hypothetical protein [Mycolicibacterium sp.]